MKSQLKFLVFIAILFLFKGVAFADPDAPTVTETSRSINITLPTSAITSEGKGFDPLKYTLGPDDAVEISVMRHPEFSGVYPINKEGKLQYKFVGDIEVNDLTKAQLEQKAIKVTKVIREIRVQLVQRVIKETLVILAPQVLLVQREIKVIKATKAILAIMA